MTLLSYDTIKFTEEKEKIRCVFLNFYYFYLDRSAVESLGPFRIKDGAIDFTGKKREANLKQKFEFLLAKGFEELKSSVNGKPCLYIHKNSGIPLIGGSNFGIIDRNTNTIEIKPASVCNIDCIFCSVDHLKRISDVIVEKDYLVSELFKVIDIKENKVNIHIGSQGDPSLYGDLVELIRDIRKNPKVNAISMVTNGIIINKKMADELIDAGLSHLHVSLHSLDQEMADRIAQTHYPVEKVKELCRHVAKRIKLLLVPVWVGGINDSDIEDVIVFAKEIGAKVGVQNFLEYDFGKKPANMIPMKVFFQRLKELEEKHNIDLTGLDGELLIVPDKKLPKPFRKGEMVDVEIKAPDRMKNLVIGVSRDRVVTIINCQKLKGIVRVKLIRDKDNIFVAAPSA